MPQLLRFGSLAFCLFIGVPAYAAPAPVDRRFHLSYTTEGTACPDRSAFLQAIAARTTRARTTDDDRSEKNAISITARVDDRVGHFSFREPDGAIEEKNITGTSCSEIAHALALSIALLLDPDSTTTSSVASSATPPPPLKPIETTAPPPRVPLQPTGRSWHPSGGVEGGAISGTGPAISFLIGFFLELDHPSFFGRPFTGSVRLGFQGGETSSDLRGGSQIYELFVGSLRVCPLLSPISRSIRIGPCAAFQLGGHRGTTRDVQNPESHTQLWVAPLVLGTLEWAFDRSTTLELSGGILFPLRRSRFFLAPDTTIYEVPRIGGSAAISLRYRFF